MGLDKAALAAFKQKPKEFFIEALGGSVNIRRFSGLERQEIKTLLSSVSTDKEHEDSLEMICSFGLSNDDGTRMFSLSELADLKQLPNTALVEIMNATLQHNALTEEAAEEAKGNSLTPAQRDDSTSV
jgi:hypothetical protein